MKYHRYLLPISLMLVLLFALAIPILILFHWPPFARAFLACNDDILLFLALYFVNACVICPFYVRLIQEAWKTARRGKYSEKPETSLAEEAEPEKEALQEQESAGSIPPGIENTANDKYDTNSEQPAPGKEKWTSRMIKKLLKLAGLDEEDY